MAGKGKSLTVELPDDWVEKVKTVNGRKIKTYINLETGQQFYSRAEVFRYINRQYMPQGTPEQPSQKSSSPQPSPKSTPQRSSPKSTPQRSSSKSPPQKSSTKSTRTNPSPMSTRQKLGKESTSQQPEKQSIRPLRVPVRLGPDDEPEKETEAVTKTNEKEDWLPSGWTMDVKYRKSGASISREYKVYTDPSTGKKFYSKAQVLRHVEVAEHGDVIDVTSKRKTRSQGLEDHSPGKPNNPENGSPSKAKKVKVNRINKEKETVDDSPTELQESPDATLGNVTPTSDWLPSGWKMVIKTKSSGSKYKCYINPTDGSKFYSKPKVLEHLGIEQTGAISLPKKKIEVSASHGTKKMIEVPASHGTPSVVLERIPPDLLPPGWIKETKIERRGNLIRKDPYYTDPETKYVFRSLPDAKRFLKYGNFKKCAIKPKHRSELDFLTEDISLLLEAAAGSSEKSQIQTNKRSRSAGIKQSDANSSTLETKSDDTPSPPPKRQRKSRFSNETIISDDTLDDDDDTLDDDDDDTLDDDDDTLDDDDDDTLDDDDTPSPPPKSQSRRKSTSSRKRANNAVSPAKSPSVNRRASGRKKTVTIPKEPTAPSRSSGRIANQLKPKAVIDQPTSTEATEAVLPVLADPISSFRDNNNHNNTVRPSLAETLNDAFGLDIGGLSDEENYNMEEVETGVENSPTRNAETTNNELFNFGSTSWCDLEIKEPEPQPEPPELEPELAWLNRPLDFVLGKEHSNAPPAAPVVQDYFQQDVTNKNVANNNQHQLDLGAPGFTNFDFHHQGSNNLPPSTTAGQFNFLSSSNNTPAVGQFNFLSSSNNTPAPANPLFHSGIMSSPANPLFPPPDNAAPNNNQSSSSPANPANPMFPPGGFGFGFQ